MKIDSHQHFWTPGRGDHDWMPQGNPILNRTYLPSDLAPILQGLDIHGTVLVQAAATVNETEYMLGLADASGFVKGVVGWVDFENPNDAKTLQRLKGHPKFKGVRPMIQDIPDDAWMLRPEVQWAYETLCDLDLTFDALGFPRHLGNFLTLLKRYPQMRVVIDHCMKPQIRDHSAENYQFWADGMSRLADTGAHCKFSALITEADADWTVDTLRPYVAHVITAFGPERVMWGSDWPVCRLRAEYDIWHAAAQTLTADLSDLARARIFGETATTFYRL
ncbi:MAG: amidohydrolase family protein [Candidatus Saccharibacteria bacterium]|nr:amidohydrolase family protein [Pseudorhodobacter sp.]